MMMVYVQRIFHLWRKNNGYSGLTKIFLTNPYYFNSKTTPQPVFLSCFTVVMRAILLLLSIMAAAGNLSAQALDTIFFNLYTDSLKLGTYNYINVEGRYTDGRYRPLGERDLKFSTTSGSFKGNSLYLDSSFTGKKVLVEVVSIKQPQLHQQIEIYIKQSPDNERLPTMDEILKGNPGKTAPSRQQNSKKRG